MIVEAGIGTLGQTGNERWFYNDGPSLGKVGLGPTLGWIKAESRLDRGWIRLDFR
jgi:hypothetical protein